MEKKSKKLITCTLSAIFVSMLVLSTNIFAASQRKTISIHANYSPTVVSASKSGDYSYSLARCYSVYPIINFYFTGNSAEAAYADVMYDGK